MKTTQGDNSIKQKGMTLLEVMLALVILGVSGLAVMNAASAALNNQAYLQDKTFALWIASNKLAELKLEKQWPDGSWRNDDLEFAGKTWYWRYQGVATGDSTFKALDIEVSDKKEGRALSYIRTYIAKP
ncbi:type II secretion system minor pseudopilin GspI [Psychromonas ossibalaenae]|uniref:type II secretion system minor pseudopilin GspI n=1 Tax=Psychromonas ossibalaenae TaxID=444922 RepID=UPI000375B28F|nr:type II secretion system minor pseudopilin GspI [Psychromonas ossibalaenae]